jgi:hypothetical protein
MKITESQLRQIIKKELLKLNEAAPTDPANAGSKPAKSGTQTATGAEGTLDVNKIAKTLGLDGAKLKTAVTNLRLGKRNSNDNQIFGDMVAKLIDASEQDTIKVMNVLKKVESD